MRAMNKVARQRTRNEALDVLRCVMMFLVVLQHAISLCRYGDGVSWGRTIVALTLTYPAVDVFAVLSGWFGVRCTWGKLVRLVALVIFCGVLSWGIAEIGRMACATIYAKRFNIIIPPSELGFDTFRYWYVGAYLKLLVLSVVLNPILAAIGRLRKKWIAFIACAFVALSYSSGLLFPWVSHSPRTIIFIYVCVRFLMMLDFDELLRNKTWLVRITYGVLLTIVLMMIGGACAGWGEIFHNYANPITIMGALLLVGVVSLVRTSNASILIRTCSVIAPSMLSVYMLHVVMLQTFLKPVPQVILSGCPYVPAVLVFTVVAAITFFACVVVDLLRRKVVGAVGDLVVRHEQSGFLKRLAAVM